MKIRIIKLKDPNDICVINLSKAFAVRKKTTANEKESDSLAIYCPGAPSIMLFPQSACKFELVQITRDGVVRFAPVDIDAIVTVFTMGD